MIELDKIIAAFMSFLWLDRGSIGQKILETSIIEARDDKYLDGSTRRILKAVFHWNPVINHTFKNTFAIAFVFFVFGPLDSTVKML